MSQESFGKHKEEQQKTITEFVVRSTGLQVSECSERNIQISQVADGKSLSMHWEHVEEVLVRKDSDGQEFLQVNFLDGRKMLLTERLVGFKPVAAAGLDISKLPKVVTTPDLISVIEAIEEAMNSEGDHKEEVDVLRRVFDSVLKGGEAIGFDLSTERAWVTRLANPGQKASA